MPLSEDFGIAARGSPSPTPRKRQPPFGLRLTVEERERLEREAAGLPLGAYIKSRVLGTPVLSRARRSGLPVADREAHAHAVDRIEQSLGLAGQPRAIVLHEKDGWRHAHCVWSRIDADTLTTRMRRHAGGPTTTRPARGMNAGHPTWVGTWSCPFKANIKPVLPSVEVGGSALKGTV